MRRRAVSIALSGLRRTVPRGWLTGPPDFVGIGAAKSGTSWWYGLIVAHPQVQRTLGAAKEVQFFGRFFAEPFTEDDVSRYHRLFPRPAGSIAGEWTPGYMVEFWTPPLLKLAAPDTRLLVLLRDPVERFRSALADARERGALDAPSAAQAFFRGLYARQLEGVLEHVDRSRLLVLQYERSVAEPEAELRKTYAFLGLADPSFIPPHLQGRTNATITSKPALDGPIRRALVRVYREDALKLAELFPEVDLRLWRSLDP